MGKQKLAAAFADIIGVITSETAHAITKSASSYAGSTYNIQDNDGSNRCTNIILSRDKTQYAASSDIFQSQDTYQSLVLTIVAQLTDAQKIQKTGWTPSSQVADFYAAILNMVTTKLTAVALVEIGQNTTSTTVNVQRCSGSQGGTNFIVSSQKNIYKFYNDLYNQNSVVQEVAADISNYIAGKQSLKATGLIAEIVKLLTILLVVVVVIILVAVGGYIAITLG